MTVLRGASTLRSVAWVTVCFALVGLGATGCKRKPPREEEPAKTSAPAEEKAAAAPTDPIEAALYNVAEHCSFNEEHAVISKCENNEKQVVIRDFNTGKMSRTDAFPKLVEALSSSDRKRSIVASKLLESAFRNSFGTTKPEEVNKDSAAKLLGLLSTLPERQVSQVAPAAVHAAMLTGQQAELYKILDELPNKEVRASAYVYLLRYGTLAELPKIQSLVQGDDERVAASAIEALRRMPGQKPEDQKQVCDFVKPLAADTRAPVAGKATAQLVACGGEYLDTALAAAQKLQKDANLDGAIVRGFDQTCVTHRGQTLGTTEQCKKLRGVLEQVLADTKLNSDARQFALLGLGLQFPDEATVKLADKYLNSDDKRLRSAAERVSRSVGAKLKAPAGAKPGASPNGAPGSLAGRKLAPQPVAPQPVSPQ